MTKKQGNTVFHQLLEESNIFETIEVLDMRLVTYRQLTVLRQRRYLVEAEINQLERMISELKNTLSDLAQESVYWEM
ncbi:MAG: hypothetical protein MI810_15445 [Flavobacteriales bacterium]|nr:hypothetical protein [Flavobacteriales bacterium]